MMHNKRRAEEEYHLPHFGPPSPQKHFKRQKGSDSDYEPNSESNNYDNSNSISHSLSNEISGSSDPSNSEINKNIFENEPSNRHSFENDRSNNNFSTPQIDKSIFLDKKEDTVNDQHGQAQSAGSFDAQKEADLAETNENKEGFGTGASQVFNMNGLIDKPIALLPNMKEITIHGDNSVYTAKSQDSTHIAIWNIKDILTQITDNQKLKIESDVFKAVNASWRLILEAKDNDVNVTLKRHFDEWKQEPEQAINASVSISYYTFPYEKGKYFSCHESNESVGLDVFTSSDPMKNHCEFSSTSPSFTFENFISGEVLKNPPAIYNLCIKLKISGDFEIEDQNVVKPNGLINDSNFGYINSLLQTLYMIAPFREALMQMNSEEDNCIVIALQRIFFRLQKSDEKPVKITPLFNSLGWSNEQRDVDEFICALSESLEQKMNKIPELKGKYESIFRGEAINYIECIGHSFTSYRPEYFYGLKLEVKNLTCIQESLKLYVKQEILDGENQYECEGYGKVDAKKGVRIKTLPPVLQIHLMRFQYDENEGRTIKLNQEFDIDETLDLDSVLEFDENATNKGSNKYRLHSIIIHKGGANYGHYIAYIRNSPDSQTWIECNDDHILTHQSSYVFEKAGGTGKRDFFMHTSGKLIEQTHLPKDSAYILFYIRESEITEMLRQPTIESIPEHILFKFNREIQWQELINQRLTNEDEAFRYFISDSTIKGWNKYGVFPAAIPIDTTQQIFLNIDFRFKFGVNSNWTLYEFITMLMKKLNDPDGKCIAVYRIDFLTLDDKVERNPMPVFTLMSSLSDRIFSESSDGGYLYYLKPFYDFLEEDHSSYQLISKISNEDYIKQLVEEEEIEKHALENGIEAYRRQEIQKYQFSVRPKPHSTDKNSDSEESSSDDGTSELHSNDSSPKKTIAIDNGLTAQIESALALVSQKGLLIIKKYDSSAMNKFEVVGDVIVDLMTNELDMIKTLIYNKFIAKSYSKEAESHSGVEELDEKTDAVSEEAYERPTQVAKVEILEKMSLFYESNFTTQTDAKLSMLENIQDLQSSATDGGILIFTMNELTTKQSMRMVNEEYISIRGAMTIKMRFITNDFHSLKVNNFDLNGTVNDTYPEFCQRLIAHMKDIGFKNDEITWEHIRLQKYDRQQKMNIGKQFPMIQICTKVKL